MTPTFKEFYNQIDEGMLRNFASGALLGASLLGGINGTNSADAATHPISTEISQQSDNVSMKTFAYYWAKYYNAEKENKYNWAIKNLKIRKSSPSPRLMQSINKAVQCFAGDEGVTADTLKQLLILTGRLESNYVNSQLESDTGAVGYWQCLVSTAKDRFKNGSAYFGKNFKRLYGKNALEYYKSLSRLQLKYKLKNDPDFCALIAAAKWIEIAHKVNNRSNNILNSIFETE